MKPNSLQVPGPEHSPQADLLASVHNLYVESPSGDAILEDVSLDVRAGEVLGVVGESGSGKTTAARAFLGYTQGGATITNGSICIGGEAVSTDNDRAARRIRGRLASYVPQNPGSSLNPSLRIGAAVREMITAHRGERPPQHLISSALETVGLPTTEEFQRRYPHQLSGGQQQRVCISVALVLEPSLVILDEPTTGLDVVTQARILAQLLRLRHDQGVSMLYVTHDLAVVAQIATRIAVLYAGRVVEEGPSHDILLRPKHPYTRGLLTSIPDHLRPGVLQAMPGVAVGVGERSAGCSFASRCPLRIPECEQAVPDLRLVGADRFARCIRAEEVAPPQVPALPLDRSLDTNIAPVLSVSHMRATHRSRRSIVVAAEDVSFALGRGQCVALVGESGSGKSTIARTIVGLHPIDQGEIKLGAEPLQPAARLRSVDERRRIQIVFQNPGDALNPRHTVRAAIKRPAVLLRGLDNRAADSEVNRLLELVRVPRPAAERYPSELSGGERQRVAIARALAAQPDVLVCDEVTSALDVSVQAAVLQLLDSVRAELGLALLFITHDLGVVASIADHVLVLDQGRVVEDGSAEDILRNPEHSYTQRLVEAAPSLSQTLDQ